MIAVRRYLDSYRHSSLHRAFLLAGSAALGHGFLLLCYPIITRLFTPTEFGAYTVFAALAAIVTSIAAWRFNAVIAIVRDDEEADRLLAICLYAVAATTFATGLVVAVFGARLTRLLNVENLTPVLWLLPVAVAFSGVYISFLGHNIRRSQFGAIAATKIHQSVFRGAAQIALGAAGAGAWGLVIGDIGGRIAGVARLVSRQTRQRVLPALLRITPAQLLETARKHRKLPIWSTWSTLFNELSLHFPLLILSAAYGREVAGWFGFATVILMGPLMLFAQAISSVFLSHARVADQNGTLPNYTLSIVRDLCTCVIGPLLLFALIAPAIFPIVFGEQWAFSGTIAQLLVPYAAVSILSSHAPHIVLLRRLQRSEFRFQFMLLLARLTVLIWGIATGGVLRTLTGFVVVNVVLLSGYALWLFHRAGCPISRVARVVVYESAVAVLLNLPALAAYFLLPQQGLLLAGVLSLALVALRIVRTLHASATPQTGLGRSPR